ncbi:MAG: SRPBCC domain-containing protein [Armatimonadetes bacterium]|nr:SRPBCC domain-containing protein [Armatimonadota bacterium]
MNTDQYTFEREFSASRERIWRAWSTLSDLAQWWGPSGCTVFGKSLEFRAGGFFHYAMSFGEEPPVWGRFNYLSIVEPNQIAWLNSFSNESCGISRAPFSDLCPLEIHNLATFTDLGDRTKLVLRAEPFGATEAEIEFFKELCETGSLEQGLAGTFDKLDRFLLDRR